MSYDTGNIFAKILRGEIPCHRIYEDEHALAFMDVMPQVDGHCLVIPKPPARNLLDADDATLASLMPAVRKVARAAMAAFGKPGCQIRQYNEAAAGQTVFHLHFHILPLDEGQPVKPHSGQMADHAVLAKQAELIREKLHSNPPFVRRG
jgi:histidine triad (HIT) family protein